MDMNVCQCAQNLSYRQVMPLTSQDLWPRQTLNWLQHRLAQAVWFWIAAAVGIAAKASQPLLQELNPLLQTFWSPGRQAIGMSWHNWIEQRLAQAWKRGWLVSRSLQAATQALRWAAQFDCAEAGSQTSVVARRVKQAPAMRKMRMSPSQHKRVAYPGMIAGLSGFVVGHAARCKPSFSKDRASAFGREGP
jgi:hypothetical protein